MFFLDVDRRRVFLPAYCRTVFSVPPKI